jgi:hypothetical protein
MYSLKSPQVFLIFEIDHQLPLGVVAPAWLLGRPSQV